jgi:hypothetical protein
MIIIIYWEVKHKMLIQFQNNTGNSGVPSGGGIQQIQLRTDGRENGDLGTVVGFRSICK